MGEKNVTSVSGTVAADEKKSRAWEATKKALSGIAAAITPHPKNETTGMCSSQGSLSQAGSSASNAAHSASSNASKTGSTLSADSSVGSQALHLKQKLIKVRSNQAACGRDLFDEPYYHGYMTGIEAGEMLGDVDGTFLVHKAAIRNKPEILVSVIWNGCPRHLRVKKTKHGNNVWLYKYCFKNVADLIRYHNRKRYPVSKKGIILYSWIQRQQWQLPYEQVELLDKIGQSDFGEFYRGKLAKGIFNRDFTVGVKTFKAENMDADSRIRFLRESNQMLGLRHKNVIRLYGVCTQKDPVMIVREYAPGGPLLNRVRNLELALSLEDKARYCRHIAAGMEYLCGEKITHRELSAKNCLLGEHDTAKVLYFGFTLLIGLQYDKRLNKPPMRWLAPETLQDGIYDWRTDVWSYGVLIWEVYSGGKHPYYEVKNHTLLRQKILMEGLRLTPPEGMPSEMAELMQQCFATEEARPHFSEICNRLSKRSALLHQLRDQVSKNLAMLRSRLERTSGASNRISVEARTARATTDND